MKKRLLTLAFDDGFAKSFRKIAGIHEEFGLSASLFVIARAPEPDFRLPDKWHNAPYAGWDLWNELVARGHEIAPHSLDHSNHALQPLEDSKRKVDQCLEIFSRRLKGFRAKESVFGFPYNRSNPQIEDYINSRMRAVRTGGDGFQPLPARDTVRLTTTGHGPENCEKHLDSLVEKLLGMESGWLVYNLHGLDEEGWGPVGTEYLRRLLERVLKTGTVDILPPGKALAAAE